MFGFSDQEKEEIKRKSIEKQRAMGIPDMPEEKGIEEMDFEEIIPGAQFLSMLTPFGLGKKLAKDGLKQGTKKLKKLLDEGVPSSADSGFFRQVYDIDAKPGSITYSKKK